MSNFESVFRTRRSSGLPGRDAMAGFSANTSTDVKPSDFRFKPLDFLHLKHCDTKACSLTLGRGRVGACQSRWKVPAGGAGMCARIADLCSACRGITTAKGSFARAADG